MARDQLAGLIFNDFPRFPGGAGRGYSLGGAMPSRIRAEAEELFLLVLTQTGILELFRRQVPDVGPWRLTGHARPPLHRAGISAICCKAGIACFPNGFDGFWSSCARLWGAPPGWTGAPMVSTGAPCENVCFTMLFHRFLLGNTFVALGERCHLAGS